jgi:hypothetical protein
MRRGLLVPLFALGALVGAIAIAGASGDGSATAGYTWTESSARPRLQRTEVAGAAIGSDVYVIGGFVPPRTTTAAVERLRRGRWTRTRALPVALNHAAAVGYRGHVYVLGGYASRNGLGQPVKTLYRYDPRRDRWSRLPGMPTARAALALGAIDGRLYAAGGADGTRQTGALEIYDIATRRWSRGPSLPVTRASRRRRPSGPLLRRRRAQPGKRQPRDRPLLRPGGAPLVAPARHAEGARRKRRGDPGRAAGGGRRRRGRRDHRRGRRLRLRGAQVVADRVDADAAPRARRGRNARRQRVDGGGRPAARYGLLGCRRDPARLGGLYRIA